MGISFSFSLAPILFWAPPHFLSNFRQSSSIFPYKILFHFWWSPLPVQHCADSSSSSSFGSFEFWGPMLSCSDNSPRRSSQPTQPLSVNKIYRLCLAWWSSHSDSDCVASTTQHDLFLLANLAWPVKTCFCQAKLIVSKPREIGLNLEKTTFIDFQRAFDRWDR